MSDKLAKRMGYGQTELRAMRSFLGEAFQPGSLDTLMEAAAHFAICHNMTLQRAVHDFIALADAADRGYPSLAALREQLSECRAEIIAPRECNAKVTAALAEVEVAK